MIVPMDKITILIFHKAKQVFLSRLQDLGVIHISAKAKPTQDDVLINMEKRVQDCTAFLKAANKAGNKNKKSSRLSKADTQDSLDAFSYVESYKKLKDELECIQQRTERLEKDIRNLTPWGDFNIENLEKLKQVGINVRFFISPIKRFKEVEEKDIYFKEISRDKTYVYFVVFEKDKRVELACDEFFCPKTDKKNIEAEYASLQKQRKEKERAVFGLFSRTRCVKEYLNRQMTELSYLNVSQNLNSALEHTIYIISGWVPRPQKQNVKSFLEEEQVYFYFTKPQATDTVPILLKNNRFARLFEPITKLFSLPKYGTIDLTAFFAPFFTLFFGFCLSDAGYGLIIFILAFLFKGRFKRDKRPLLTLVMILGVSTFLFGLISGNLFGVDLSKIHGIKKVVLFSQNQLFNFALVLGVIQVIFGMVLKAINRMRQFGFMSGVSTLGWIIMLFGFMGLTVSKVSLLAVYTGIALILLFNDLKANIFVRIGKGLWELYGITGIFGDVLSYIRLFALGISGSILGLVVNEIALEFRHIPIFGFVITFVILVIGHTGNLLLCGLSSFVHPLRLTFVEFYKNAGFEAGGKAYNPFRQIS